MKEKKHICVWSGKRGGFGALTPTLHEIQRHPDLRLSVVVTDQHLYDKFGKTVTEVESVVPIAAAIDMEQKGDSNQDRARAIGVCLSRSADILADLHPDFLLIIGDRGEVFAAAIAAHNLRIAIAHIQGGDVSGSLDEPVRHAITKLSHLHFPSTPSAARRILKMGEEPWRVHVVGDTHIDPFFLNKMTPENELREKYGLPRDEPFLLVLQHSDSTEPQNSAAQMNKTAVATLSFGLRTLWVYPCSDQGYEGIIQEIEKVRGNPKSTIHKNIPASDFAGLQVIAGVVIGNSSAGLIEAPYFKLPAVNIGFRQINREHCENVLNTPYDVGKIQEAIRKALYDVDFRQSLVKIQPPFGDGTAYKKITNVLANTTVDEKLLNKRMAY